MAHFGGTHESAKTDERNQFKKMIEYAKRSKVSFIIVYSLERFSRNDNAIWLSRQLREAGIQIISVTQPIDTSNPSGVFQQNILFLFGQYDNDLRRQKCMAGTKERLLQGYWVAKAPLGYDQITNSKEQRVFVNEKGKLLRKAFLWKANEGLSSQDIIKRLKLQKLIVSQQRLSEIFRNPFYCGLLVHTQLEGKVLEGKHEPLVSRELFLSVNGVLASNHQKYHHQKENNELPLTRFIKCADCGTSFVGYIVKKKGLYYYKCNKIGCKCNKSAKELHSKFKDLLSTFIFDERLLPLLKDQLEETFIELNNSNDDNTKAQEKQLKELAERIEKLEERFILNEIDRELYEKFATKYKAERNEIQQQMKDSGFGISNLPEFLNMALSIASKINITWELADYAMREKLQYALFPEGILYDRQINGYRTNRTNSIFQLISYISDKLPNKKKGTTNPKIDYSPLVARRGVEPLLPE